MSTIHFNKLEARWLQSQLQGWYEMNWPGSTLPGQTGTVAQFDPAEKEFVLNFLQQIRIVVANPKTDVTLSDPQQLFIKNWLLMFKDSSAGNYIFKGPFGSNMLEGDQFPDGTGSANQNFTGQGSFPENQFYPQANIFNSILQKLGAPQYPAPPDIYHSPGEI